MMASVSSLNEPVIVSFGGRPSRLAKFTRQYPFSFTISPFDSSVPRSPNSFVGTSPVVAAVP